MTAIVSAVNLYNNSHINVLDPSPSHTFSFLQLMNSSLDAILATGTDAIGAYSNGGYGSGGAISTETERRRSGAHSGAVAAQSQEPLALAESPSAAGTAPQLQFDSFHHASAQEAQNVTNYPPPLAYLDQSNHSLAVTPPPQDLIYSSSSPALPSSVPMSITSAMHEASSTSNSTTAKRTAPEYAEGSSSRSSKKNRKSRIVAASVFDENDGKDVVSAERQSVPPTAPVVVQQKEEATKQSTSQHPPSTTTKPPVPPRSPSPPHDLHKPAVPSPLCPAAAAPCLPSRPPRRRTRSNEIALLKFALDPWLRLSRSLDGSKSTLGGGCKQSFNPATFPATGNLRELRMSRCCVSSSASNYGDSYGDFELSLPFNFGAASSDITFGFGNGDLAGGVKWNLVDA